MAAERPERRPHAERGNEGKSDGRSARDRPGPILPSLRDPDGGPSGTSCSPEDAGIGEGHATADGGRFPGLHLHPAAPSFTTSDPISKKYEQRDEAEPSVAVDSAALIKKLNKTCLNALQAAAGLCLSRTNHSVEVEHWLLKLAEAPDTDLTRIFRHFEVDTVAPASAT